MKTETYEKILTILKYVLKNTEFEGHVYSVGGCERDCMCHREIKDIDLVIDIPNGGIRLAKYLEEHNLLSGHPVIYENFGTAMFRLAEEPEIELEAVQTRKEAYRDENSRNPEITFGTVHDDCIRRDFTYNAIYRNIDSGDINDFNGRSVSDLSLNLLRTCGDPDIIFTEDPLRILRACRFVARFDSSVDNATFEGMKKHAERLTIISKERIQEELNKILVCDKEGRTSGLRLMLITGALKYVIDGYDGNSGEIALAALSKSYCNELTVNLAILLSFVRDPEKHLKELKYSNDIISEVLFLIKSNRLIVNVEYGNSSVEIRKFQYLCKTLEMFYKAMSVFRCTINDTVLADYVERRTEQMIDKNHIMFGYILPVNGNDVMEILNIGPSVEVKNVMDKLMDIAYENPKLSREFFINYLMSFKNGKVEN